MCQRSREAVCGACQSRGRQAVGGVSEAGGGVPWGVSEPGGGGPWGHAVGHVRGQGRRAVRGVSEAEGDGLRGGVRARGRRAVRHQMPREAGCGMCQSPGEAVCWPVLVVMCIQAKGRIRVAKMHGSTSKSQVCKSGPSL